MAKKEEREIKQGVRQGGHVYLPGEEDALAEVLTEEDAARLVESGALVGAWSGKKPASKGAADTGKAK